MGHPPDLQRLARDLARAIVAQVRRQAQQKNAARMQQHPGDDASADPTPKTEGPPSNGGPKRTGDYSPTTEDQS